MSVLFAGCLVSSLPLHLRSPSVILLLLLHSILPVFFLLLPLTHLEFISRRICTLLSYVFPGACLRWRLMVRAPLPRWVHPGGRVVLLGDACHPMLVSLSIYLVLTSRSHEWLLCFTCEPQLWTVSSCRNRGHRPDHLAPSHARTST